MTHDELMLERASFDFAALQTTYEMTDFNGNKVRFIAPGVVRFKNIKTEEAPVFDERNVMTGTEKVYVVRRDEILSAPGVFKRVSS